ncbi:MAG: hypothetical protein IJS65_02805 [Clostridia bacterium]|nr:hypothetical protein [Clostridia bacterium]
MNEKKDYMEIDLLRLGRAILKRWWLIAIVSILGGVIAFGYASYFVKPTYTSKAQILVVNSAASNTAGRNPTASELNAAQQLANTYMVIIKSTSTMKRVMDKLGINVSPEVLQRMIKTEIVPDTEIFKVKVTALSPEGAKQIADALVEVFPEEIPYPNSVLNVIEEPDLPRSRTSPNRTRYAFIGMVLGFILSAGIVVITDMTDDIIRSEDHLVQNYDLPILVVIPDLHDYGEGHSTGYYRYSSSKPKEGETK